MKKMIWRLIVLLVLSVFAASTFATNLPSDQQIDRALKKHLVIGKTSLQECESLFGRPVSVVENAQSKVYAFKSSAVAKGLKLGEQKNSSSLGASAAGVEKSSSRAVIKSVSASVSKSNILKSEKQSVDKIINFVFKDNKLLSYKISSSR